MKILVDVGGEGGDAEFALSCQFKQLGSSGVKHVIKCEELFDEFDLLLFAHLFYFYFLEVVLEGVSVFEPFGVGHHSLPDDLTSFQLLCDGCVVVL